MAISRTEIFTLKKNIVTINLMHAILRPMSHETYLLALVRFHESIDLLHVRSDGCLKYKKFKKI